METYKLFDVLKEENQLLTERRRRLFGEEAAAKFDKTKFGIALSGGGIRSATINLGFLKTLNKFNILEKADYISTVSGGGYTGSYIQATLRDADYAIRQAKPAANNTEEEKEAYKELFEEQKITHLRNYGDYLIPGQTKWQKLWSTLVLSIGFLVSWVMSLLSLIITAACIYILLKVLTSLSLLDDQQFLLNWNYEKNKITEYLYPPLLVLGGIIFIHFVSNLLFNFSLNVSKVFNQLETAVAVLVLVFLGVIGIISIDTTGKWEGVEILYGLLAAAGLYVAGFFLNPNSLSFHRFYRKQLADAFLRRAIIFRNLLLKDVFFLNPTQSGDPTTSTRGHLAPYPLINTCLNLQNPGGEDKFKGAKASDYFLLSPLYCGSKLSNYVKTAEFPGFKHLTLPAAVTISAAAVNPGMGIYSNKLLSIMMTLFNARLGFWVNNPLSKPRKWLPEWSRYIVWWPTFFFNELLSKIGTGNRKLNISDGGHIENLAVYELLRRGCRLIMAVDAGADPGSTFADLENLSIRARNELGIELCFRPGQDPVDIIRPRPSSGYAQKRFAIADLLKIWEEFPVQDANGKPVTITRTISEGDKTIKKTFKLEALVNYFYSKNDARVLKFRVDLKAQRGIEIPGDEFDQLHKLTVAAVKAKLDAMGDLSGMEKIKIGTLVYIKSSVTPPRKLFVPEFSHDLEKNLQFDTFKYKIYHPDFPHESTADQFFDPVQWESYYQLGQFIATDVLDAPKAPDEYQPGEKDISIDQLLSHFDKDENLFDKKDRLVGLEDASAVPPTVADEAELEVARPKKPQVLPETTPAVPVPELKRVQEEIAEEMQFKI
jgi:predicted acylesterase/phospholipase RssA